MKKIQVVFFVLFPLAQVYAAWAPIYDVGLSPLQPTIVTDITVHASGEIGSPLWYVDSTQVNIAANLIVLDIFFKESGVGIPEIASWNHDENIGMLSQGSYSLTVKTYQNAQFADSFQTGFAVVPEPASVGLFSVGGLIMYCRKKRAGPSRSCMPFCR